MDYSNSFVRLEFRSHTQNSMKKNTAINVILNPSKKLTGSLKPVNPRVIEIPADIIPPAIPPSNTKNASFREIFSFSIFVHIPEKVKFTIAGLFAA